MTAIRPLIFILLAATLSACGFHLRGTYHIPDTLHTLALDIPGNSRLEAPLRNRLRVAHIDTSSGDYTLKVIKEKLSKQTTNTDSRAKAAEYTFLYELHYELHNREGKAVSPEYKLLLRRSYQYDTTAIVGKSEEEETLLTELYQEAAHQIVQRLGFFKPLPTQPAAQGNQP